MGGNRSFSLKLICCLTEREDWSAACTIRNQTLVQNLICQSYVRSIQRWKVIFVAQQRQKGRDKKYWMRVCVTFKASLHGSADGFQKSGYSSLKIGPLLHAALNISNEPHVEKQNLTASKVPLSLLLRVS